MVYTYGSYILWFNKKKRRGKKRIMIWIWKILQKDEMRQSHTENDVFHSINKQHTQEKK